MSFWPLLVPAVVIASLALFFWYAVREEPRRIQPVSGLGKLGKLRRIVSVMITATAGPRVVEISVPGRKARLCIAFDKAGCGVRLPILTNEQAKNKAELTEAIRRVCRDVDVSGDGSAVIGRINGDTDEVVLALDELIKVTLAAVKNTSLRFEMSVCPGDEYLMGLDPKRPLSSDHAGELNPTSVTRGNRLMYAFGDPFLGCQIILLMLFLHPLPFLLLFTFYGLTAACVFGLFVHLPIATAMAITWNKKQGANNAPAFLLNSAITVVCYALTIAQDKAVFAQLIPTVFALVCVGKAVLAFRRNSVWPFALDKQDAEYNSSERSGVMIGVVAVCLLAALANEFIRSRFSIETWVWYYAYFRLELFAGIMLATMPGLSSASERSWANKQTQSNQKR